MVPDVAQNRSIRQAPFKPSSSRTEENTQFY